jgi:hypothetical protein
MTSSRALLLGVLLLLAGTHAEKLGKVPGMDTRGDATPEVCIHTSLEPVYLPIARLTSESKKIIFLSEI